MLHTPENRPKTMKSATNRQRLTANCQSRRCAYCGKDMTQGHSAMGMERFIGWAKDAGVRMAVEDGRYLNPRCAEKIRALLKTSHAIGDVR